MYLKIYSQSFRVALKIVEILCMNKYKYNRKDKFA